MRITVVTTSGFFLLGCDSGVEVGEIFDDSEEHTVSLS
jgi:hypothetical protein